MFNEPKKIGEIYKKHKILWTIIFDIITALAMLQLVPDFGTVRTVAVLVLVIFLLTYIKDLDVASEKANYLGYVCSFVFAVCISILIFNHQLMYNDFSKLLRMAFIPMNILVLMRLSLLPFSGIKYIVSNEDIVGSFLRSLLCISVPVFILTVYLPVDMFVANQADMKFSLTTFLGDFAITWLKISLVCALFCSVLKESVLKAVHGLAIGFTLAIYAQYLFMNIGLPVIGMGVYKWKDNAAIAVINLIVYILLIAAPVVCAYKLPKIWEKAKMIAPSVIGGIHALSVVMIIIAGGSALYEVNNVYFISDEEQYVLSSKENVVVFVFDAADNTYLDELLETDPSAFDEFNDFTLYNNTCSVYNSTEVSMPTMFGGGEFDTSLTAKEWFSHAWKSERPTEFYKRLHENGFRVNAYNMNGGPIENWYGLFDNVKNSDEVENKPDFDSVDKYTMRSNFKSLVSYKVLPLMMKHLAKAEKVSFADVTGIKNEQNYLNGDFLKKMHLTLSDSDDKYMTIQHSFGTHIPAVVSAALSECLEIAREYVRQMKALGVYDNATIIFTSDHGEHWHNFGATPIFLIKEPYASHDTMQISSAPIYHTDILPTILVNTGLFNEETDRDIIGTPIYDYNEDSLRERTFYQVTYNSDYPRVATTFKLAFSASHNVYERYTYTGDDQLLRDLVDKKQMSEIHPMLEYYG